MASFTDWLPPALQRLLPKQDQGLVRETVETLRHTLLFEELPQAHLRDLAHVIHYRDYKSDEYIYHEHDPGLGLYIVQQGEVMLLTEDEEGDPHRVHMVPRHGVFGVASLAGAFRRTETAQAQAATRLLGFFRPDLKTLQQRYPRAGMAVGLALARYLAMQQESLRKAAANKEGKVAALHHLYEPTTP